MPSDTILIVGYPDFVEKHLKGIRDPDVDLLCVRINCQNKRHSNINKRFKNGKFKNVCDKRNAIVKCVETNLKNLEPTE